MSWLPGSTTKPEYVTIEDYNKSMQTMADLIETHKMDMVDQVHEQVRGVMAEIALATLPTLEEPKATFYWNRMHDGVWRKAATPQDAIRLRGEGHEMRISLEWDGIERVSDSVNTF